jgi:hypothetical protein
MVEAFQQGLREVGLVETRDVVLDVVRSGGDVQQAVRGLIDRGAEVLVTSGTAPR